jgi:hypothetical protein
VQPQATDIAGEIIILLGKHASLVGDALKLDVFRDGDLLRMWVRIQKSLAHHGESELFAQGDAFRLKKFHVF